MPVTNKQMELWYGGETDACISKTTLDPSTGKFNKTEQWCGQIVPPTGAVQDALDRGQLRACIRTEQLEIECGRVKELYSPGFLKDNWGWIALVLLAAYVLYSRRTSNAQPPTQ